ncbi:MAG: hypothetical protein ACLQUT_06365 [Thermoleophilia bacterium]
MRFYVAFDDTDILGADRGTGKVGRWFEEKLPAGYRLWGVVRQQLLVHPDVPYTSHNSSAVVVIDSDDDDTDMHAATSPAEEREPIVVNSLVERGIAHLAEHWLEGSDPGLCIAWDGCTALPGLVTFGHRAATEVVTQEQARDAAAGAHLSGHGGSEDGIIGAAAGVGLTVDGWNGRFIEYRCAYGLLRDVPDPIAVADLERIGITVVSLDRDAPVPLPGEFVHTADWLRPRLWAGRPVLPVQRDGVTGWVAVGPRTVTVNEGSSQD